MERSTPTDDGSDSARGRSHGHRETFGNVDVVVYTVSHLLAVVAEWSVFIGVLVYAQDHGGANAVGLASIALLVPYVIAAPIAGALAERYPPWHVRVSGLAVQALAYGVAASAAWSSTPTVAVVAAGMIALAAVTTLRPAGAVLLPAIVRTSRELTVANLWQGNGESVSVLGGPLLATGLLLVGGAPAAITGSAVAAGVAVLLSCVWRPVDPPGGAVESGRAGAVTVLRNQVAVLRARRGVGGVLAVAGGQYILIGGLDVILVVIAAENLDLGEAGAGVLTTAMGVGALVSTVVATRLSRHTRLAPALMLGLAVAALGSIVLGTVLTVATALLILPLIGLARSTVDVLSRMLLQRSAAPQDLGAVFAVVELVSGAGLILGSALAQVLIATAGAHVALIGLGVFFGALMFTTTGSLRQADAAADIPVVAMSLLRRLPVFAPLPPLELEAVARSAGEVSTRPAEPVIREGEHGDLFYAVADGNYDVTIAGRPIRTISRGGSFGEIALLADVPRTATVTSRDEGALLTVERGAFLLAVTGHDSSRRAAWSAVRVMESAVPVPDDIADDIPGDVAD